MMRSASPACATSGTAESSRSACTTLILACNGFAGNSSLVAKYLPDVRGLPFAGHDGSQGDALAWGTALDAQFADIDGFLAHGAVILSQRLPLPWSLMTEGAVQVNRDGERFVNEHEGYSESALFVLAQPGATAFMIYDERVHEIGLTMPNYATAVTSGVIKRESLLRDLAEQLGVKREGLEATIALVNALAFDDAADEFGREFRATQMLLGPYYGVPVRAHCSAPKGTGDRCDGPSTAQERFAVSQPARRRRRRRGASRVMRREATWKAMAC